MVRSRSCLCIATAAAFLAARPAPPQVAYAWFPIQPGNSWIYEHEARDGARGGIANPDTEQWESKEAIVRTTELPEGTMVTARITTRALKLSPRWLPRNDESRRAPSEAFLLLHDDCAFDLHEIASEDPLNTWDALDHDRRLRLPYRAALAHGAVQPKWCFPMTADATWGKLPTQSGDDEGVWRVAGINGDPFGLRGHHTFHLVAHQSSGTIAHVWFTEGIGVLQEVVEHHGTYWEERRRLRQATIGGRTSTYRLEPARTAPLGATECAAGWRHFVRADGTLIDNVQSCIAYATPHK